MRPVDGNWRIYRRDRIKPELQGRPIFVLELPWGSGLPARRHVFDPSGMEFPSRSRQGITTLLAQRRRVVIFDGVSKTAVYRAMASAPALLESDPQLEFYNQSLMKNSQNFFLTQPDPELQEVPAALPSSAAPQDFMRAPT